MGAAAARLAWSENESIVHETHVAAGGMGATARPRSNDHLLRSPGMPGPRVSSGYPRYDIVPGMALPGTRECGIINRLWFYDCGRARRTQWSTSSKNTPATPLPGSVT